MSSETVAAPSDRLTAAILEGALHFFGEAVKGDDETALDAYVEWLSEDDGEEEDEEEEGDGDGGEDGGAEVEVGGEFPGFEDQR